MTMTSETIKINLIPGEELPVLHSSQYDTGRALTFEVYDGDDAFDSATAYEITLHLRKVDGSIISLSDPNVDENQVIFFTTEQTTACAGKNVGELSFYDEVQETVVGSCNFILEIEPDPMQGGLESESEIQNLNGQIASLIDQQLDNYYTKTEIDEQITTIIEEQVTPTVSSIVAEMVPPAVQAELGNYYDKSEVDILLGNKADSDDVYTKTQVDALTGTFVTGTLTAGNTTLTLTDESITTSSIIDIYTDIFGVNPDSALTTTGQIVLTFPEQVIDMSVKVKVI